MNTDTTTHGNDPAVLALRGRNRVLRAAVTTWYILFPKPDRQSPEFWAGVAFMRYAVRGHMPAGTR